MNYNYSSSIQNTKNSLQKLIRVDIAFIIFLIIYALKNSNKKNQMYFDNFILITNNTKILE